VNAASVSAGGADGHASAAGSAGGVSGRTRVSPWRPGWSTRVTSSGDAVGVEAAVVGDGSVRLVPQDVQNAAPSGTAAPHCGQVWSVNCSLLDRAAIILPDAAQPRRGASLGRRRCRSRLSVRAAPAVADTAPRPGERRDAGVGCTRRLTVTG